MYVKTIIKCQAILPHRTNTNATVSYIKHTHKLGFFLELGHIHIDTSAIMPPSFFRHIKIQHCAKLRHNSTCVSAEISNGKQRANHHLLKTQSSSTHALNSRQYNHSSNVQLYPQCHTSGSMAQK